MKCGIVFLATLAVAWGFTPTISPAVTRVTKRIDAASKGFGGIVAAEVNTLLQRFPKEFDVIMYSIVPVIDVIHPTAIETFKNANRIEPAMEPGIDGIFNSLRDYVHSAIIFTPASSLTGPLRNIISAIHVLTKTVIGKVEFYFNLDVPVAPGVGGTLALILFGLYGTVLEILSNLLGNWFHWNKPLALRPTVAKLTTLVNAAADVLDKVDLDLASKVNPTKDMLGGLKQLDTYIQWILTSL